MNPFRDEYCECDSATFTPDDDRACDVCGRFVPFDSGQDACDWIERMKKPDQRGDNEELAAIQGALRERESPSFWLPRASHEELVDACKRAGKLAEQPSRLGLTENNECPLTCDCRNNKRRKEPLH